MNQQSNACEIREINMHTLLGIIPVTKIDLGLSLVVREEWWVCRLQTAFISFQYTFVGGLIDQVLWVDIETFIRLGKCIQLDLLCHCNVRSG